MKLPQIPFSNWKKERVANFFRIGLVIMSIALLITVGLKTVPNALPASTKTLRELPIYCVSTDKPQVALSFDAAWGNEDTATLLEILEEYEVKASFFMTGGWMEKYPEDVKAIAQAGHDIGNHSENHKQMSQLTKDQCKEEIAKPHEKIKALLGIEMTLFRPPYGDYNNTLVKAVRESNYHCIQWDVDSLDWKDYGVDNIVNTILNHNHLGNGSIILMHNGAKYTKDALPSIITGLREKGYELVPISELIYTENYYMDQEGRQFEGEK